MIQSEGGSLKQRVLRIILAVVIAPLTILPIVFGYLAMIEVSTASNPWAFLEWLPLVGLIGIAVSYATTVVFGLPVYFLLLHFRKTSYPVFVAAGALGALLVGLFIFDLPVEQIEIVWGSALIASGVVVAIAFRKIAGVPEGN